MNVHHTLNKTFISKLQCIHIHHFLIIIFVLTESNIDPVPLISLSTNKFKWKNGRISTWEVKRWNGDEKKIFFIFLNIPKQVWNKQLYFSTTKVVVNLTMKQTATHHKTSTNFDWSWLDKSRHLKWLSHRVSKCKLTITWTWQGSRRR